MIYPELIPRSFYIAVSVLLVAVLGMSIYAWHMRGRALAVPVVPVDTRPVLAPVAGPTERVTLFVAYDDIGVLRVAEAFESMRAGTARPWPESPSRAEQR